MQNLGSLAYESQQYLKAIDSYAEVDSKLFPTFRETAICYMQLLEPVMTLKFMEEGIKIHPEKSLHLFTKEVIEWVYFGERGGSWGQQLPNVREDLFYERHFYGVALLDKLEVELREKEPLSDEDLKESISSLLKDPSKVQLRRVSDNLRFERVQAMLLKGEVSQVEKGKELDISEVLKLCFNKSEKPEEDIDRLLKLLGECGGGGG